jgi:hypothetical protein
MTNPMTTTGDTIYSSSGSTPARLGIGTAGQVLTVNTGATAPEWKTPAAGGATYVGVAAFADDVLQGVSNTTATAILYPSESYDTDAFHSTSTNTSRITIPTGKGGKYQFTAWCSISATVTGVLQLRLLKNGSTTGGNGTEGLIGNVTAGADRVSGTVTVEAAANDYFEIFVYFSSGGASRDVRYSRFSADYLGA